MTVDQKFLYKTVNALRVGHVLSSGTVRAFCTSYGSRLRVSAQRLLSSGLGDLLFRVPQGHDLAVVGWRAVAVGGQTGTATGCHTMTQASTNHEVDNTRRSNHLRDSDPPRWGRRGRGSTPRPPWRRVRVQDTQHLRSGQLHQDQLMTRLVRRDTRFRPSSVAPSDAHA
jgi:hypothetical protein